MSPPTPDEVRLMHAYASARRNPEQPFDIVVEGETPGDDLQAAAQIVWPYVQAGASWWIEAQWTADSLEVVMKRLRAGPPKVLP
jgi:hypothetical protein